MFMGSDPNDCMGHAGQILIVPALTPQKFSTGPDELPGGAHPPEPAVRHGVGSNDWPSIVLGGLIAWPGLLPRT